MSTTPPNTSLIEKARTSWLNFYEHPIGWLLGVALLGVGTFAMIVGLLQGLLGVPVMIVLCPWAPETLLITLGALLMLGVCAKVDDSLSTHRANQGAEIDRLEKELARRDTDLRNLQTEKQQLERNVEDAKRSATVADGLARGALEIASKEYRELEEKLAEERTVRSKNEQLIMELEEGLKGERVRTEAVREQREAAKAQCAAVVENFKYQEELRRQNELLFWNANSLHFEWEDQSVEEAGMIRGTIRIRNLSPFIWKIESLIIESGTVKAVRSPTSFAASGELYQMAPQVMPERAIIVPFKCIRNSGNYVRNDIVEVYLSNGSMVSCQARRGDEPPITIQVPLLRPRLVRVT